jgi:hypothetical protein
MATPTTPTSMQGLVAVSGDGKIKPLGYLTWFSIPDEAVGLRRLKQTLAVHGLPLSLAPKDTKAIDTFKRAMRAQEGRHRNGVITETAVAQVDETPDDCVYQISRVTRDLDERTIDYPKAMRVVFNKTTEEIAFNPLGGIPRSELLPMTEAIQEFYDKNSAKVTGARVRTIVRNYLRSEPDEQRGIDGVSGENLRGKAGGIYFIPAQYVEQISALSAMLHELYHGRAYLHGVPMADGKSEREIIRAHHIANTRQEMKEAMAEVKGLLSADRERAPRSDVVANKWSQYHALERRAAKYAKLLEDEQDEINDMARLLHRQLDKLVG